MFNPNRITRKELINRLEFHCKHGHNGLTGHPQCYNKLNGENRNIAIIDIESTALNASFGWIISVCIKKLGGGITKLLVKPEEILEGTTDKRLCQEFVKEMDKFDMIVGHYSGKFDIPMLRTRCVFWNISFPRYADLIQKDTCQILWQKFKLHSNRLEAACDFFGIESKRHRLKPNLWQQAQAGNQKALNYILKHNEEDVISTEKLWLKINQYIAPSKTSI